MDYHSLQLTWTIPSLSRPPRRGLFGPRQSRFIEPRSLIPDRKVYSRPGDHQMLDLQHKRFVQLKVLSKFVSARRRNSKLIYLRWLPADSTKAFLPITEYTLRRSTM